MVPDNQQQQVPYSLLVDQQQGKVLLLVVFGRC